MRAMNSETVDLIATDPPFNKGHDFHATPDSLASGASFQDRWSWENDVHEEWLDQINDDHPHLMAVIENSRKTYGDDMGAYLCFMAVRLISMRRLLKPTGSIYLHCDPTASHYLKMIMDAIFGRSNFRNEIVWCYRKMPNNAKFFQRNHDLILFYSKTDSYTFNRLEGQMTEGSKRTFESGKRRGYNANNSKKMVTVFDWDKYHDAVRKGKIPDDLKPTEFKGGNPPEKDWWADIKILGGPKNKERYGYATQKPIALYKKFIQASSDRGGGSA